MTEVVTDKEARQARPGRPILYVLIASLVLVGVYLVTMLGWSGSTTPPSTPTTTQQGPAGSTSPPANPAQPAPNTR